MSGKIRAPLGLGPVFAYEWLIASRRWQGYALRSLFVLLLLTALVIIWASNRGARTSSTLSGLATIGASFYIAVIGTQLTLVLLAAPAATAGAICLDRARGTLEHLLVTDLSAREIVLGKLAARLVPVLGLLGCTLPVMAMLTLLGGVDPDALLKAFVVTLGVAVLGCCLALAFSLWAGKTHEALLGTYAVWGLWLLSAPMLRQLNLAMSWTPLSPLDMADPFAMAFAPYWWPGRVGWEAYLGFLAVTWALSSLLALATVVRLRALGTRGEDRRARRWNIRFGRILPKRSGPILRLPRMPGPTLDFNPVLWREWHRNRPSRWARFVATLYVTLAAVFSVVAIGAGNGVAAWVNGLQVSIGLLMLSVTAATALAEERMRGSLDVLMATPMSTRQIVLGKWLGTFRLVPPLTVLPVLVILGAATFEIDKWLGAVLTTVFVLCSGAAVTSLGLALATWFSRLGRAVGLTVALYVLVTVGWLFVALMLPGGPKSDGLLMGSSFYWVGELTFELCNGQAVRNTRSAIAWTIAYGLAAVAFLAATLASFNSCLGRVETGLRSGRKRHRMPVKLVLVQKQEALGEPLEIA